MLKNVNLGSFLLLLMVTACYAQYSVPNVVFIYTDDQAAWTLGHYGNPDAHTPNLDSMAADGAFLINYFVSTPVCSPSRASLMTGRYASELGISDFIPQPGHPLYNSKRAIGLDPASITFAEVLQKNGYKTALIGKWHLGDWTASGDLKYHPNNHGFDYFMGLTGGGASPIDPTLEKNGMVLTFKGLTTDILTNEAIGFIKKNRHIPFLLCLNFRAPHAKWLPVAPEDWRPYESLDPVIPNPNYPDLDIEKVKGKTREYLASTTGVDRNVGRLFKALDSLGLTKNTIVIFTSDHGYNMGHNGIEHKGNGMWITKSLPDGSKDIPAKRRPNLYDNSLKVPAIVKWPEVISPGTVVKQTTTNMDWYPTILDMLNIQLPQNHLTRGKSILPLLKGKDVSDWDNTFYSEYSMIHYAKAYMRSFRTTDWKLIKDFNNPERDELYHISIDPEENINLIHDSRQEVRMVIQHLEKKIRKKMQQLKDPLLLANSKSTQN
jgi:uncharacterized sulfatase